MCILYELCAVHLWQYTQSFRQPNPVFLFILKPRSVPFNLLSTCRRSSGNLVGFPSPLHFNSNPQVKPWPKQALPPPPCGFFLLNKIYRVLVTKFAKNTQMGGNTRLIYRKKNLSRLVNKQNNSKSIKEEYGLEISFLDIRVLVS